MQGVRRLRLDGEGHLKTQDDRGRPSVARRVIHSTVCVSEPSKSCTWVEEREEGARTARSCCRARYQGAKHAVARCAHKRHRVHATLLINKKNERREKKSVKAACLNDISYSTKTAPRTSTEITSVGSASSKRTYSLLDRQSHADSAGQPRQAITRRTSSERHGNA